MGDGAQVGMKAEFLPECAEGAVGGVEPPMAGCVPAAVSSHSSATCSRLRSERFPILKSSPAPVFINKPSVEHSPVLPLHTVCDCFPTTMADWRH